MEAKPILIQGAMEDEIAQIKEKLQNIKQIELQGYLFYQGEINNSPIVISKTGVGLIEVTTATILAINKFTPCMIINQGIAGGITKNVHKGDIILGNTCININSFQTPIKQENEGSNPFTWELKTFKEGKDELVILNANKTLINFFEEKLKEVNLPYKIGRIGSGDVWNAEKDRLLWLSKNYEVLCEDMETVAVYQLAEKFNIPAIGIRIISDNALLEEPYDKTLGKKLGNLIVSILKGGYVRISANII